MSEWIPGLEPSTPVQKFTERDMLDALARRHTQVSQGVNDRWVRAEHVRNGTGKTEWKVAA